MRSDLRKPRALTGAIYRRAVVDAFLELDPRHMVRNPMMFLHE
jgi:high-affinity K+ transport system ATPase subunit B